MKDIKSAGAKTTESELADLEKAVVFGTAEFSEELEDELLQQMPDSGGSRVGNISAVIAAVIAVASVVLMFSPVSREVVGGMSIVLMLALLALKFPVFMTLGLTGGLTIWALIDFRAVASLLGTLPVSSTSSWSLAVLPMFIFMGTALWQTGLTTKVYDAARAWLSWLPGGLAVTTNSAGGGLAAISGSTLGITFAVARIGIPEMLRAGYDKRLAVGSVQVAGLAGQLIPPSVMLVLYAGIAETPVGPQLLAGVIPGFLMILLFSAVIITIGIFKPSMAPKPDLKFSWSQRFRSLIGVIPIAALILLVVGGIFGGFFTSTEAGAYGALGATILGLVANGWRKGTQAIVRSAFTAVVTTSAIMIILVGAMLFSRGLAVSGLATWLVDFPVSLNLSATEFMFALLIVFLILGSALEGLTMLILTYPILQPILANYGIDMIAFGVFMVILAEVAIVSPPVGMVSFVVHKISQEPDVNLGERVTLKDVFVGVTWFLPAALILLVALIYWPELATWLPNLGSTK